MGKLLLGALLLNPFFLLGDLRFSLREGKPGYEILNIRGVEVYKAPELARITLRDKQIMINFVSNLLISAEKHIPHTLSEFKKRGYKIMLFEENIKDNGLEFLREGQHKWDKRIDKRGKMDKSIIFIKTISYTNLGSRKALFYFIHEMAHFRHLALANEYTPRIKRTYRSAIAKNKYFGTYSSKNHLEYFAEVSASFLLPRALGHMYPRGAAEVRQYDIEAFNLCGEVWRDDILVKSNMVRAKRAVVFSEPAPKPRNPILIRREKPEKSGRYTTAHNNDPITFQEYNIAYTAMSNAQFWRYRGHAEKAMQKYRESYEKFSEFNLKYPNWQNGMAKRRIAKLEAEIQAFGNLLRSQ